MASVKLLNLYYPIFLVLVINASLSFYGSQITSGVVYEEELKRNGKWSAVATLLCLLGC